MFGNLSDDRCVSAQLRVKIYNQDHMSGTIMFLFESNLNIFISPHHLPVKMTCAAFLQFLQYFSTEVLTISAPVKMRFFKICYLNKSTFKNCPAN